MSKISYSVMKKLKLDRLLKRQANFDHVIVFDDEFETKYNTINNRYYWLTFVDFCSTYKYDPNGSCIKTATYNDIVNKMNEWIKQLPQYRCRDRLQPGQPIWTIINCETLYAKIVLNFSENGEITRKRVMQYSKWPLNDELYMNLYCENNTMTQNFEQIFNGKYIVILLRIWMTKQSYYPLMLIAPSSPPPIIAIKDYWPKKITIFDDQNHSITSASNNHRKIIIKKIELGKKLRRTLSMESGSNNNHNNHSHNNNNDDIVQNNNNNGGNNHLNNHSISHSNAHNQPKECLEKLTHIAKRINDDIINKQINGRILNLITFPCYYFKECNFNNHQNVSNEPIKDVGNKIPNGHIVNLIRVFYVLKPSVCQYENDSSDQQTPKELIGIIDFVPRCISGGGFIKYPRFETQTDIIDKATIWMTKNSQIKYLNFSSIDIKLRSMTSIDSSEMTFARNTGDFLRIIRLYYLRPYLPNENAENMNEMTTDTSLMNWKPSAPIYLQCKNIVSINNSLKELQQQMNDYLLKVRKNELQNVNHNQYQLYTGADIERWRFICVDSVSIFISNTGHSSANSSANDSRSRRNLIMADCDKSFHAITISSNHSSINRNMLNVINIYYDIGLYGRRPKSNMTLSLNDDNKQQQSMNVNATTEDKHQIDQHDQYLKSPKNCSNPTLTNSSDPNSCLIA